MARARLDPNKTWKRIERRKLSLDEVAPLEATTDSAAR